MTIHFHYKGFAFEDAIESKQPHESASLASKSLYQAWFEVLKRSPWYIKKMESPISYDLVPDRTYEAFGDIRNMSFRDWWMQRGYEIFSETRPYRDVEEIVKAITPKHLSEKDKAKNTLILSIPLNLDRRYLMDQINDAIQIAQDDLAMRRSIAQDRARHTDDFNRHMFSSAEVYLYDDNRLTANGIWEKLIFYKKYIDYRNRRGRRFKQYEFCREINEAKHLWNQSARAEEIQLGVQVERDVRVNASAAISDKLKEIYRLMAHATQLRFPCIEDHEWVGLTEINDEFFDNDGKFLFDLPSTEFKWPK